MKTLTAPDLTEGYPSKGRKLGPAWTAIWTDLDAHRDEWMDGRELADRHAPEHGLQPGTVVALLTRMATAGILQRDHKTVPSGRGGRSRTHYKIAG